MMIEALIIKYHSRLKAWEGYKAPPGDIGMSMAADANVVLLREIIADLTLLMNKGQRPEEASDLICNNGAMSSLVISF